VEWAGFPRAGGEAVCATQQVHTPHAVTLEPVLMTESADHGSPSNFVLEYGVDDSSPGCSHTQRRKVFPAQTYGWSRVVEMHIRSFRTNLGCRLLNRMSKSDVRGLASRQALAHRIRLRRLHWCSQYPHTLRGDRRGVLPGIVVQSMPPSAERLHCDAENSTAAQFHHQESIQSPQSPYSVKNVTGPQRRSHRQRFTERLRTCAQPHAIHVSSGRT
jgi:hypothetical protein